MASTLTDLKVSDVGPSRRVGVDAKGSIFTCLKNSDACLTGADAGGFTDLKKSDTCPRLLAGIEGVGSDFTDLKKLKAC